MAREEYLIKLGMLEQEAGRIQEQMQIASQQAQELDLLKSSLDKIGKEKDILAPLGRGVYFKASMKEEKVWVNIGSGVVLKKTSEEAKKIIDEQIIQLEEIKRNLEQVAGDINFQLQNLLIEARKSGEK